MLCRKGSVGGAQEWAHHPPSMSSFETPPGWEFYDLAKDPREMNNLNGEEEYATIITDLKVRLKALRAEVGEDDTAFPKIAAAVEAHWDD